MSTEFAIHSALWDTTYVSGKTDESDVDTSSGASMFNTWTTAMQVAISSELNTWNTWYAAKKYGVVL